MLNAIHKGPNNNCDNGDDLISSSQIFRYASVNVFGVIAAVLVIHQLPNPNTIPGDVSQGVEDWIAHL